MKRITRLISGPPSRGRWGPRAGIAVVLVAGTLLTLQVVGASNVRPGLHIRSTTDGVLRPGDTREISAHGLGGDRYYRAEVDAHGRLAEVYKRDGKPQPIDAGVRGWLAEVTRLSVPPHPRSTRTTCSACTPPPLTAGEFPPPPPAPPEPPEITETAAFQALVRLVAADRGVVGRVGTPVAMSSNDVRGRIDMDNGTRADGDADLTFDISGPKGRTTVHVVAQMDDGVWSMDSVDLVGPER